MPERTSLTKKWSTTLTCLGAIDRVCEVSEVRVDGGMSLTCKNMVGADGIEPPTAGV
jgi:hypothetical protein